MLKRSVIAFVLFVLAAAAINLPLAVRSMSGPALPVTINVYGPEAVARGWPIAPPPESDPWPAVSQWVQEGSFLARRRQGWSLNQARRTTHQMDVELYGWPLPVIRRTQIWSYPDASPRYDPALPTIEDLGMGGPGGNGGMGGSSPGGIGGGGGRGGVGLGAPGGPGAPGGLGFGGSGGMGGSNSYVDTGIVLHWPGVLLNPLLGAAALWLALVAPVVTFVVVRRRLRIRRSQCPRCAYPIGDSPRCSECGFELSIPRRSVQPNTTAV